MNQGIEQSQALLLRDATYEAIASLFLIADVFAQSISPRMNSSCSCIRASLASRSAFIVSERKEARYRDIDGEGRRGACGRRRAKD